jgi:hypothetical protein
LIDEALLLMARVLLRVTAPDRAHRVLRSVGRLLPARTDSEEVRRAALALRGPGSCLSRSLAIAARAPRSEVVIGVAPKGSGLDAHAWIEIDRKPLSPTDPLGEEIARLH